MFDLGWLELIVIGVTALIVVGPKELPQLFRTVGRFFGKAKAMAREFSQSMEDAANESGLKDATKTLNSISDLHKKTQRPLKDQVVSNFKERINPIEDSINSTGNFKVGEKSIDEKPLKTSEAQANKKKISAGKTNKTASKGKR